MAKNLRKVTTTQAETQELFEGLNFNPSKAYSDFCLLYLTMVIFQPVLPMGALTGFVALVLTYYAYKKMLLRDSKRPVMVSKDIPLITLYLLNLAPLCYGVISANTRCPRPSSTRYSATASATTPGRYWALV